jgi:hypothetical protein
METNRLTQSSTDLKTTDHYLFLNEENCSRKTRAIRIESAVMASDYSHLLNHSIKHPSQSIMNMNMNRTIDLIKRTGAGDENLSLQFNNKQVQTSITNDHNQRKIHLTSKQFILISISVFLLVILLCLLTIIFIF